MLTKYIRLTQRQHNEVLLPEDVINHILDYVYYNAWRERITRVHKTYREWVRVVPCDRFDCRGVSHGCEYLRLTTVQFSFYYNARHFDEVGPWCRISNVRESLQSLKECGRRDHCPLSPNYVHQSDWLPVTTKRQWCRRRHRPGRRKVHL